MINWKYVKGRGDGAFYDPSQRLLQATSKITTKITQDNLSLGQIRNRDLQEEMLITQRVVTA
jgi:hypothetical protein